MNKKILVTLGSTEFETLIDICDVQNDSYEINFQIGNSKKKPIHNPYFSFKNQTDLYNGYDLIVTHAGAGSVFKLLELKKKIIVVTNYDRKDHHQSELSSYVKKSNFALVYGINEMKNLNFLDVINDMDKSKFSLYVKDEFKTSKIINFFEK